MRSESLRALSLIVFAVCLCVGDAGGNAFGTIVSGRWWQWWRRWLSDWSSAAMAQKMLDENLNAARNDKSKNSAKIGRRTDR